MADEGLYADSLHTDYRLQLNGHWTQVVPLQLGIAQPDRAEMVLDRLENICLISPLVQQNVTLNM